MLRCCYRLRVPYSATARRSFWLRVCTRAATTAVLPPPYTVLPARRVLPRVRCRASPLVHYLRVPSLPPHRALVPAAEPACHACACRAHLCVRLCSPSTGLVLYRAGAPLLLRYHRVGSLARWLYHGSPRTTLLHCRHYWFALLPPPHRIRARSLVRGCIYLRVRHCRALPAAAHRHRSLRARLLRLLRAFWFFGSLPSFKVRLMQQRWRFHAFAARITRPSGSLRTLLPPAHRARSSRARAVLLYGWRRANGQPSTPHRHDALPPRSSPACARHMPFAFGVTLNALRAHRVVWLPRATRTRVAAAHGSSFVRTRRAFAVLLLRARAAAFRCCTRRVSTRIWFCTAATRDKTFCRFAQ